MKEANHKGPHIVWFHLYEMCRTGRSVETEGKWVGAQGWGGCMGGPGIVQVWGGVVKLL